MLLLSIYLLGILHFGLVVSDISGDNPECGKCLCASVSSTLNIRDAPDGTKIGSIENGNCRKYTGEKETAGGYTWFSLDYNGDPNAWAAGEYLVIGSDSSCSASSDDEIQASAKPCVCVTASSLNARRSPSTSSDIEDEMANGECRLTTGQMKTADGYNWFQILIGGASRWAAGEYLEIGCFSQCEYDKCSQVDIVSRSEWNARDHGSIQSISKPVPHVFIHHTAGSECTTTDACKSTVRGIQNYHMDTNGWSDIGYSFLIGGDGKVYEGRGWDLQGAHTSGYNAQGYGISFIGDYSSVVPSTKMLNAAKMLIACGVQKGHLSDYSLAGHKDTKCTECPGAALYNELQSWDKWHKTSIPPPACW